MFPFIARPCMHLDESVSHFRSGQFPPNSFAPLAPPVDPESAFVHAGGVRLHYLEWPGEGEPVLLLPGMGQSAHIFRELVPALGLHRRVVALTPRGHGESQTPHHGYTMAGLAEDARAVMDALGMARAAVVGHSMGGGVAAELAAAHPERVSKLVLLDAVTDYAGLVRVYARNPVRPPPMPMPGTDDGAEREWQRTYTLGLWNGAVEADWRAWASPDAPLQQRRELLLELLESAASTPPPWPRLRCPALALLAVESVETQYPWLAPDDPRVHLARAYLRDVRAPWRRAATERFRSEAADARVVQVRGGHFFFLSDPARTAALIRGFLDEPALATRGDR